MQQALVVDVINISGFDTCGARITNAFPFNRDLISNLLSVDKNNHFIYGPGFIWV
jgi:hypothetical protein